jgi:hypothetical protein
MKREDLTGKRFGKLVALEYVGNKKWLCQCDCGNKTQSATNNLKSGKSTSCGCTKGEKRREDLTGKRFGKLTALEYLGARKWLCQCDCGKKTSVLNHNLKSGATSSCGCYLEGKFIDLLGQRFGRLKVIGYIQPKDGKRGRWDCLCDCGNRKSFVTHHLTEMGVASCGCLLSERITERNTTHGQSHSRLYGIWRNMKDRCSNPNTTFFDNYGGRGIKVCDEWINSFESFHDWSINNGYKDDLTIDRIENNLDYEPSNCRWITMKEQANNTRKNLHFTYNGETHTLPEWCEIKNVSYDKVYQRIHKLKWDFDRAINTP